MQVCPELFSASAVAVIYALMVETGQTSTSEADSMVTELADMPLSDIDPYHSISIPSLVQVMLEIRNRDELPSWLPLPNEGFGTQARSDGRQKAHNASRAIAFIRSWRNCKLQRDSSDRRSVSILSIPAVGVGIRGLVARAATSPVQTRFSNVVSLEVHPCRSITNAIADRASRRAASGRSVVRVITSRNPLITSRLRASASWSWL